MKSAKTYQEVTRRLNIMYERLHRANMPADAQQVLLILAMLEDARNMDQAEFEDAVNRAKPWLTADGVIEDWEG